MVIMTMTMITRMAVINADDDDNDNGTIAMMMT